MLTEKELEILRSNAKVHKLVFDSIKEVVKVGTTAKEINELSLRICQEHNVLPAFHGVYGFPAYICISVNDVVVHGIPRDEIVFQK
jgi:methionyl aminopeptidase